MRSPERPQAWAAPAENVAPGPVFEDVVVVRDADVAVWLSDLAATPDGVRMRLTGLAREATADDEGRLTLEVAFADGRGATLTHGDPQPADVVLHAMSGSHDEHEDMGNAWLWPLPPDGPVTFTARWPAARLTEAVATIDGAVLREAAARATILWEDERPEGWRRAGRFGGGRRRATNVLPFTVPVDLALGRDASWAVWVERVAVGPDGALSLTVDVAARAELPEGAPRVAVGAATSRSGDEASGGRRARFAFRADALPEEGPLTLAFAWPEAGIGELAAEVDAAPLRAAAARAVELWPPAPRERGEGWPRYAP